MNYSKGWKGWPYLLGFIALEILVVIGLVAYLFASGKWSL